MTHTATPSLFDLPTGPDEVPQVPHSAVLPAPARFDWAAIHAELDAGGVAVTPPLLSPEQCAEIAATFDDPALFRSTVVMQRHDFGRGVYKYYADPPAIPLLGALRELLYPPLAWMANQWAPRLGERTFPATLGELTAECAANGQTRPTPLILRYGQGDYACLHQDVYGDVVFPLQVAIMLNRPGEDFTGGENVFVEQRPRLQSRAIVIRPGLGQGMIFPVRHRPVPGPNGFRRHPVRHGTNAVETGRRNVLGIIFHDAR
ncbi:2OG-Fe(II) oxygenase [Streptomyces yaizuensis]|uniref:2OG-Fe(II) oxygenase n=1 Tax=Streptomyces yaizuensis TaxID=2989713 RepID=A0ABQ5P6A0_9ACTN|nr:2OG-Fe(II) oxygenase [Streptomyces sp. YSPA8]GLF97761.1 2OG-Fe(II) oxygenase [Streptomyces sp. YSPA8]